MDTRVIAVITTLLPDGSPHSVIADAPRVNVLVVNAENPRRYVEVRGTAIVEAAELSPRPSTRRRCGQCES